MRRRRLKLALHRFYPGTLSKEFIEVSICWFRCECWDLTATEKQLCRLACNTICLTTNISLESTGFVWLTLFGGWLTFQHILLHLNLVEFVGADNDAVAGEVDTAAGLWCLNFLQKQTKVRPLFFFSSSLLPKGRQKNAAVCLWHYHSSINLTGSPTFLMQNLFRLSLCRRIVILLGIAAHIQVPLSIYKEKKKTLQ